MSNCKIRVGQGYDVHRLVEGRPLILGGVQIPHSLGLDGHSDADVLLHAVTDASLPFRSMTHSKKKATMERSPAP